jgi:two-component system CheB/CheR fusion protein
MSKTIQGRLGAMASAHTLVRPRRRGYGVETSVTTLHEIIDTILQPYIGTAEPENESRAISEGSDVAVGGDAATSLAMVLHELATNAAKYGAFSTPGGRVHISWRITEKRLRLIWAEQGGPAIEGAPEREGFGSLLARRSIAGQLDGQMTYEWKPEGLTIHLSAAAERLLP